MDGTRRFVGVACAWLMLACGGRDLNSTPIGRCTPESQKSCACPGESAGAQRCKADGTFDECVCPAGADDAGAAIPDSGSTDTSTATVAGGDFAGTGGVATNTSGQGGTLGFGGSNGGVSGNSTGMASHTSTTGTSGTGGQSVEQACPELAAGLNCGDDPVFCQPRAVNMLVVLDKSGSMTQTSNGLEKWAAVKSALATVLTSVRDSINFGLELFPTPILGSDVIDRLECGQVGNCCEMPAHLEMNLPVTSGPAAVDAIIKVLDSTAPGGGTPTARALERALDYFTNGHGYNLDGDKFVLLVTDGGPNCNEALSCGLDMCTYNLDELTRDCTAQSPDNNCCAGSGTGCVDSSNVVSHIEQLASAGIGTFVVGIPASEVYSSFLDSFAEAGGHPVVGGENSYYRVGDILELTRVFEEIVLAARCDIKLPMTTTVTPRVFLDCVEVLGADSTAGQNWAWWSGSDRLTLLGPTCRSFATDASRLDVVLNCPGGQ